MERVQKQSRSNERDSGAEGASPSVSKKAVSSREATDALLDEIDAVLEQNATEFIRDYVQRGGQ